MSFYLLFRLRETIAFIVQKVILNEQCHLWPFTALRLDSELPVLYIPERMVRVGQRGEMERKVKWNRGAGTLPLHYTLETSGELGF